MGGSTNQLAGVGAKDTYASKNVKLYVVAKVLARHREVSKENFSSTTPAISIIVSSAVSIRFILIRKNSIVIGIENIWYQKKVSVSVTIQHFGYRHTLIGRSSRHHYQHDLT